MAVRIIFLENFIFLAVEALRLSKTFSRDPPHALSKPSSCSLKPLLLLSRNPPPNYVSYSQTKRFVQVNWKLNSYQFCLLNFSNPCNLKDLIFFWTENISHEIYHIKLYLIRIYLIKLYLIRKYLIKIYLMIYEYISLVFFYSLH